LQLSNVARPVKRGEPLNRCRREAVDDVIGLCGEPFSKNAFASGHDVLAAFAAAGGQVNRNALMR